MTELELLKTVLRYEPDTGLFYWKVDQNSRAMAGSVAGSVRKATGYVKIVAFKKYYAAHRLAWAFVYGYWPSILDHKDRNRSNNAIANLRECTASQNAANRDFSSMNTSGYRGVVEKSPSRWQAQACVAGTNFYLGIFDTPEEASARYEEFCTAVRGEFHLARTKEVRA